MKDREKQQHEMLKTLQTLQGKTTTPDPVQNVPKTAENPAPISPGQVNSQPPQNQPIITPEKPKNDRIVFFEPNNDDEKKDELIDPEKAKMEVDQSGDQTVITYDKTNDPDPEVIFKICHNDECNKSFQEDTGYGKLKSSKYHDQFCSKSCQHSFIGRKAVKKRESNKKKK
jgi:hypothetical protein